MGSGRVLGAGAVKSSAFLLGWQESVLGLARNLVSLVLMLMRAERQGDTESKLWVTKRRVREPYARFETGLWCQAQPRHVVSRSMSSAGPMSLEETKAGWCLGTSSDGWYIITIDYKTGM